MKTVKLAGLVLFLSTLSLRRATEQAPYIAWETQISIHALLAESDGFYPLKTLIILTFLSTLSLRRATLVLRKITITVDISIHALLAESDPTRTLTGCVYMYFYPRSPCGERRVSFA